MLALLGSIFTFKTEIHVKPCSLILREKISFSTKHDLRSLRGRVK
jgi:hypothetical protein